MRRSSTVTICHRHSKQRTRVDRKTRLTLESAVTNFERDLIADALKSTRGNIVKAAEMLESTERILGYKIRKYNIDPKRFK